MAGGTDFDGVRCVQCDRTGDAVAKCPKCHPELAPKPLRAADVRVLGTITTHPIPVDRVVCADIAERLKTAVVIGWDKEGSFFFSSSTPDGGDVLWLIEQAKLKLLTVGDRT